MSHYHIIIPARYASGRLPKKLLLPILGKPMLQHVYERACQANAASVTIATDHPEIFDLMSKIGAKVLMTSAEHPNGTSRLAEAVALLNLPADDIVVNLQGDEPLMPAVLLQQVAHNLATHSQATIATLCEAIDQVEEIFNPHNVKVVRDQNNFALYFSRAPIPYQREGFSLDKQLTPSYCAKQVFRHIGLYAYRVNFLQAYTQLTETTLEKLEALEQLRFLYFGYKIHVEESKLACPGGIDTEEDYLKICQHLES